MLCMLDETTIRTVLGTTLSVVGFLLMTGVAITAYFLKSIHKDFKSMADTIQEIRLELAALRSDDRSRHEAVTMLKNEFDELRRDLSKVSMQVSRLDVAR